MKIVSKYKLQIELFFRDENGNMSSVYAIFVQKTYPTFTPEQVDMIAEKYNIENYECFSVEILEQWNEFVD